MSKIKISIIGCSGYTGLELIKTISSHPYIEISSLIANENSGKYISDLSSSLIMLKLPKILLEKK